MSKELRNEDLDDDVDGFDGFTAEEIELKRQDLQEKQEKEKQEKELDSDEAQRIQEEEEQRAAAVKIQAAARSKNVRNQIQREQLKEIESTIPKDKLSLMRKIFEKVNSEDIESLSDTINKEKLLAVCAKAKAFQGVFVDIPANDDGMIGWKEFLEFYLKAVKSDALTVEPEQSGTASMFGFLSSPATDQASESEKQTFKDQDFQKVFDYVDSRAKEKKRKEEREAKRRK